MIKIKPPYLGVAYYPEDWDISEIDKDIKKMLEIGINVARIGEFAWHKMEPRDGEFDFSWLHFVVEKLKNAGLAIVMGTPTAVPPVWLTKKYPDMLIEYRNGRVMQHSGRRHACSNHPEYLKYSARIVEKMAMEFGKEEAIIGWQIDNEIYLQNNEGCFCDNCKKKYHEHLEKKFGTVDEMNKRLNLNLFSQWYDSFDEVPMPRDTWENPHLKQEFLISAGRANIDFVAMQAEILKKYTNAPIGTDQIPLNGMNYRELHIDKALEVVKPEVPKLPYGKIGEATTKCGNVIREIAACDKFTAKVIDLKEMVEISEKDTFVSLIVLEGNAVVEWEKEELNLKKGDSLFIPATLKVKIKGIAQLLYSCV